MAKDNPSTKGPKKKGIQTEESPLEIKPTTNHLLLIAIDDYQHLPRLNNCVRDAHGLMEVLLRQYTFEPGNVHTLFNDEATGENIIRTLERLPGDFKEEDNLLIFFSGHGEYRDRQKEGFWAPVDARRDITKDLISVPDLKMYLNPLPCHHLVLVIDACFSGSIFKRYRSLRQPSPTLTEASRWGLTSGRLEPVLDGRPGMHSPFAESLIKQLKANTESLRIDQLYNLIVSDLQQMGFEEQAPDSGYLDLSGNRRGMFLLQPRKPKEETDEKIDYEVKIDRSTLHIIQGDIVEVQADAVVSSDDTELSMSGGVAAAICKAAGPRLQEFTRQHFADPLRVGDVVETAAFDLEANYIFHAITLDRSTWAYSDDRTIAAMTRRCLELADERQLRYIAFPAIGTGTAGAPFQSTAQAMINAICSHLVRGSGIDRVTITLFVQDTPGRKEGLRSFYQKAIHQGAAWSKLEQYLEELPELLRVLKKEDFNKDVLELHRNLLGKR